MCIRDRIWKPNFRSFLSSLLSAIPLALRELCYHFHAKLAGIYWLALKEPQTDLEAQFPFFPVESSQRDPTCSARALLAFPCQTCRDLLACSQRGPLQRRSRKVFSQSGSVASRLTIPVSYTHLRAHETPEHLVCRLLLEK